MATTFMSERLLKAALALLAQNEPVEVRYVGFGKWQECMLLGAGPAPNTVRLGVWCAAGEILQEGRRPIRFIDCLVPPETLARLEVIAAKQEEPSEREARLTEKGRALVFAAKAVQRKRNGQFADGTHRAEPAGVR